MTILVSAGSASSLLSHKSTTATESFRIAARTLDWSILREVTRFAAGETLNLRGRVVETLTFSTLTLLLEMMAISFQEVPPEFFFAVEEVDAKTGVGAKVKTGVWIATGVVIESGIEIGVEIRSSPIHYFYVSKEVIEQKRRNQPSVLSLRHDDSTPCH